MRTADRSSPATFERFGPAMHRLISHLARIAAGRLARLCDDARGAAAVEFAMLLPVLLLMLAGLIDVTRLISHTMQVKAAAQAGADFAQVRGWKPDEIAGAVTAATQLSVSASPAPAMATACVSGQTIVETTASTCAAGGPPGRFVTVAAQGPFKPLIPWPGMGMPRAVTAQAVVRIP
jgi:Flp pilus assembly protein TadG